MQQSIRVWDEVLKFVGGKLEISKYNFRIIDWEFDHNEQPILKNNKETISFIILENIKLRSQQLSTDDAMTCLGVISQTIGKEVVVTKELRKN